MSTDVDKPPYLHKNNNNDSNNNASVPVITPLHWVLISSFPLCLGAFAGYRMEVSRGKKTTASEACDKALNRPTKIPINSFLPLGQITNHQVSSPPMSSPAFLPVESSSRTILSSSILLESQKLKAVGEAVHPVSPVVNGPSLAFKALGIGTMLSIGGVGLLTAGRFVTVSPSRNLFHYLFEFVNVFHLIFSPIILQICTEQLLIWRLAVYRAHGCNSLAELIHIWKEWAPRKRKELLEDRWGIYPISMELEDVKATKGMTEDEEWSYIKQTYIPELVSEDERSNVSNRSH